MTILLSIRTSQVSVLCVFYNNTFRLILMGTNIFFSFITEQWALNSYCDRTECFYFSQLFNWKLLGDIDHEAENTKQTNKNNWKDILRKSIKNNILDKIEYSCDRSHTIWMRIIIVLKWFYGERDELTSKYFSIQ